ncbi:hypothetical protein F511_09655 [Dorcoceras hygrometricum]|uniref:Uncharacterized protein n=1 Tax=Dorcoceras hygrometricum TaxID=472368 RepID=A0A2Z7AAX3_9LAMI|nr:hypothetical protein F511_09655 [Dorcoceras hygrometricum]
MLACWVDCPLPSAAVEITKIQLGKLISIPGVDEENWYKASLPKIPATDNGKAPLQIRDPIKGKPPKEIFSLILADTELGTSSARYCLNVNLSTVDISNILSVIVQDRSVATVFDSVVQSSPVLLLTDSSSVFSNEDDQMDIDHRSDSPDISHDSSMHFVEDDIHLEDDSAPDQFILPSSATAISASLAALRESFSNLVSNQSRDFRKTSDAHSKVMCKINHVERVFLDSLAEQNETFRGLFKRSRQEAQNDNNALSLALKALRTQNAILSTDLAATQKEKHKDNWLPLVLTFQNSLPFSLRAVMTKRGKIVAAAALNRLPMIKTDQVVAVVVDQMIRADMVESLSAEMLEQEAAVVKVGEEVIRVDQRENYPVVVVSHRFVEETQKGEAVDHHGEGANCKCRLLNLISFDDLISDAIIRVLTLAKLRHLDKLKRQHLV